MDITIHIFEENEKLVNELNEKGELTVTLNWLLECYKRALKLIKEVNVSEYEATVYEIVKKLKELK